MIQKITNYDLLTLPAKIGQIYYVTDMRCLFQDTGKLRQNRQRLSALVLNTDYERLNRIRPQNGKNYYVIETNFLWSYDTKWVLRDGDIKKYNSYTYNSTNGVSPIVNEDSYITSQQTGDRILDNNGLLGDGSVVVRDQNRLIKSNISVDTKNNAIAFTSQLDNGIIFYPYGFSGDEKERTEVGSLHLGIQTRLNNPGMDENLEHSGLATYYGDVELYGDAYTLQVKSVFDYGLDYIPNWEDEKMSHQFTCSKTIQNSDSSYKMFYKITIFDITQSYAKIQIITYNNSSNAAVTDGDGNLVYEGPLLLDSDITYDCIRTINSSTDCDYTIISNNHSFKLTGQTVSPLVTFSHPFEYTDNQNTIYAKSEVVKKIKISKYSGLVEIVRCDS